MASKARELANLGNAYSDGALSNRNLIINGAMQVAQRGTSATSVANIGYNTVDRFGGNSANAGSFSHTDEQSSDAPVGFIKSRKITVTTAQTTSSGTRNQVRHQVEGFNCSQLNWGTSNAKTVTLSFWVKSSVTGPMAVSFINQSETHSYVSNYTVNVSNTWEYKTITVEGPTVGTWNTNETIGVRLAWDLGSGSTNEAPSADTWHTGWYYRTSSSVRLAETLNATWQITGVQLEVGDTATPFEHRSYGQELALCQRYFEAVSVQGSGSDKDIGHGASNASGAPNFQASVFWKVPKRSSPTVTLAAAGRFYCHLPGVSRTVCNTISVTEATSFGVHFSGTSQFNFQGAGQMCFIAAIGAENGNIMTADSEL